MTKYILEYTTDISAAHHLPGYQGLCQNLHGHNWFGLEYRLKDRVRGVLHTHHGGLNTEWWKPNPPIKLNLVAISDWMKRVYAGQGHTVEFVYNGIDLNKYGLYTGKRNGRLVFVGRIDKFKKRFGGRIGS